MCTTYLSILYYCKQQVCSSVEIASLFLRLCHHHINCWLTLYIKTPFGQLSLNNSWIYNPKFIDYSASFTQEPKKITITFDRKICLQIVFKCSVQITIVAFVLVNHMFLFIEFIDLFLVVFAHYVKVCWWAVCFCGWNMKFHNANNK